MAKPLTAGTLAMVMLACALGDAAPVPAPSGYSCSRPFLGRGDCSHPRRRAGQPTRLCRRLRGGGAHGEHTPPGADAAAKWGMLSAWLSARWDDIPGEHKGRLREFALQMVHDKAGICASTRTRPAAVAASAR
jgi:hypothetical protein